MSGARDDIGNKSSIGSQDQPRRSHEIIAPQRRSHPLQTNHEAKAENPLTELSDEEDDALPTVRRSVTPAAPSINNEKTPLLRQARSAHTMQDLEQGRVLVEEDIYANIEKLSNNPPKDEHHDMSRWKRYTINAALITGAVITSAPAAINAFLTGLKTNASSLSFALWKKAPLRLKAWALLLFTATLALNIILAINSFVAAFSDLFTLDTWKKNPFRMMIAFGLGLAGAASIFAVGIESMSFSMAFAFSMSFAALFINLATRSISANTALKRGAEQLFDKDLQLQSRYLKKIKRIKKECLPEINAYLLEKSELPEMRILAQTNPDGYYARMLYFLDFKVSLMSQMKSDDDIHPLLTDSCLTEAQLKSFTQGSFDITIGSLMAITAYIVFELKGENALRILGLLGKTSAEANLACGTASGIASAILYFLSAYDYVPCLTNAIYAVKQSKNPKEYAILATLIAGMFLSGANMFYVGDSVENDKNSIFHQLLALIPNLFPWIAGLGGALVNGKAALLTFFKRNAVVNFQKLESGVVEDIVGAIVDVYSTTGLKMHKNIKDPRFPEAFTHYLRSNANAIFAHRHGVTENNSAQMHSSRSIYLPS